jgi:hypothetical protein
MPARSALCHGAVRTDRRGRARNRPGAGRPTRPRIGSVAAVSEWPSVGDVGAGWVHRYPVARREASGHGQRPDRGARGHGHPEGFPRSGGGVISRRGYSSERVDAPRRAVAPRYRELRRRNHGVGRRRCRLRSAPAASGVGASTARRSASRTASYFCVSPSGVVVAHVPEPTSRRSCFSAEISTASPRPTPRNLRPVAVSSPDEFAGPSRHAVLMSESLLRVTGRLRPLLDRNVLRFLSGRSGRFPHRAR